MAIGKRYPRLVFAGLIFAGSHATAGNLSLYSIDGGVITEGMVNITTGDGNVAISANALAATTSGSNNVAIGDDALRSNTDGGQNTAIGKNALYSNTTSSQNVTIILTLFIIILPGLIIQR